MGRKKHAVYIFSMLLTATANAASAPALNEKLIEIGKKGILEKLKDPESARFKEMSIHRGETLTAGLYYV